MECSICHAYPMEQSYICGTCFRLQFSKHLRVIRHNNNATSSIKRDIAELLKKSSKGISREPPAHLHIQHLNEQIRAKQTELTQINQYIQYETQTRSKKLHAYKKVMPLLNSNLGADESIMRHYKMDEKNFLQRKPDQHIVNARRTVAKSILQNIELVDFSPEGAVPAATTAASSALASLTRRGSTSNSASSQQISAAQSNQSASSGPSSGSNSNRNSNHNLQNASTAHNRSSGDILTGTTQGRSSQGNASTSIMHQPRPTNENPHYYIELFHDVMKFPFLSAPTILHWLKGDLTPDETVSIANRLASPPSMDDLNNLNATLGYIAMIVENLGRNLFVKLPCRIHFEGSTSRICEIPVHHSSKEKSKKDSPNELLDHPLYYPTNGATPPSDCLQQLEKALYFLGVNIAYLCFIHGIVVAQVNRQHFMHNLLALKRHPRLSIEYHEYYKRQLILEPNPMDSFMFESSFGGNFFEEQRRAPVTFFENGSSSPSLSAENYYIDNHYSTKYVRVTPVKDAKRRLRRREMHSHLMDESAVIGTLDQIPDDRGAPFDSDSPNRPSVHKVWPRGYLSGTLKPDFLLSLRDNEDK